MDSADAALDRVFNKARARCSLVAAHDTPARGAVVLGTFVVAVLVVVIVLQNSWTQPAVLAPNRTATLRTWAKRLNKHIAKLTDYAADTSR